MGIRSSLSVGLAWSFGVFAIINGLDFVRRPACHDCGFPRGVPFTIYYDAGLFSATGRGDILWTGLIADAAVALFSGILLAWLMRVTAGKSGRPA